MVIEGNSRLNTQRFRWKKGPNQAKKGRNINGTSVNTQFPAQNGVAFDTMNRLFSDRIYDGLQRILRNEFENRKVGMKQEGNTVVWNGLSMGCIIDCSKIVYMTLVLFQIFAKCMSFIGLELLADSKENVPITFCQKLGTTNFFIVDGVKGGLVAKEGNVFAWISHELTGRRNGTQMKASIRVFLDSCKFSIGRNDGRIYPHTLMQCVDRLHGFKAIVFGVPPCYTNAQIEMLTNVVVDVVFSKENELNLFPVAVDEFVDFCYGMKGFVGF